MFVHFWYIKTFRINSREEIIVVYIQFNFFAAKQCHIIRLLPFYNNTKMNNSTSYSINGPSMHQTTIASSIFSEETSRWPTTLSAVVSPEQPTVDRGTPATSVEASTSATVEDVKLPWEHVDGIMMTPDWSKMSPLAPEKSDSTTPTSCIMLYGVAKKPNEATLSSSEDDEGDLLEDLDFAVSTRDWLRSEEKEKEERNKRKAEEHMEEDKKRRATKGYCPAFIIDVEGVPLEKIENEYRLVAAAAAGHLSQYKHIWK